MKRLQVELILSFFRHRAQIWTQHRFGDCFGVVVVVLLTLRERLHVNGGNDSWLVAEAAQHAADEVSAEARLRAYNAGRQLLEFLFKSLALDLLAERDFSFGIEADDVEDIFADIDTNRCKDLGCMGFRYIRLLLKQAG